MHLYVILCSVICLLVSTLLAFLAPKLSFFGKKAKPIYILLTGAFLAIFVMMLYFDYNPTLHGSATTMFLAFLHTIQALLLGYDFKWFYESLSISAPYATFTYFYLSALLILAPIYTFSFVLSFFESVTAYFKYLMHRRADLYILSDLSAESLALARSVRKKFAKALIVFANVDTDENNVLLDLVEEAHKIKAIHFKKPIGEIKLHLHSKAAKITCFAVHADEAVNLEIALNLIDTLRECKNTELYVFSASEEGELLLDSAEKGLLKVRRINEIRALAYSMIYEHSITENVTVCDGQKIISTLIVGMGGYGTELTKALLWCGQLPGYDLKINIIDKDANAEARFQALCPEILKLNRNTLPGEAHYNLTFHNGVDTETYALNEVVEKLTDTSVVYVSLGNDERNIKTAIRLRILFGRIGLHPVIRAIVYSDIKYKTLQSRNLCNHQKKSYDIEFIGNISNRFSYDTIINEELERIALQCHLAWANTPEAKADAIHQFNQYEYFRRSSVATAIHERYRKQENITGDTATVTEHMRWNAYMRTEGFVYTGSPEKHTRNDLAKMHHNLHAFEILTKEDIAKDTRIATGKKEA